jgi:hypothetical protein
MVRYRNDLQYNHDHQITGNELKTSKIATLKNVHGEWLLL